MWIFQNDAFLSVVAHRDQEGMLLVRSRIKGDIERAVPNANVFEDPSADYRYRAIVSKQAFAEALAQKVHEIDYPNFKNSVKDKARGNAYVKVWRVMADAFGAFGLDLSKKQLERVPPSKFGFSDDNYEVDLFLND